MSAANAAAIKRRANIVPDNILASQRRGQEFTNTASVSTNGFGSSTRAGLTLQEAISVIDSRLSYLEKNTVIKDDLDGNSTNDISDAMTAHIEDFNSRFELLAIELDTIKTVVMNLQSYTMEVNKRLLDERLVVSSNYVNDIVFESREDSVDAVDTDSLVV